VTDGSKGGAQVKREADAIYPRQLPKGAVTAQQKAKLSPRLVRALICQEIDPVTQIGTAATGFFFNERAVENCIPGGVPLSEHPDKIFWTVEALVAASYFSQPRRNEMQHAIAAAFVDIVDDDGSVVEREDIRISPAYLMRLHVVVVEIPEGSWGVGGQTIDTQKIAKLIGATQGSPRLAEALELGEKMKRARLCPTVQDSGRPAIVQNAKPHARILDSPKWLQASNQLASAHVDPESLRSTWRRRRTGQLAPRSG
jgi:hypothetical protein